ncbi:MAG: SGNH/GDSL hydrolase family protein [Pseudarthrobacter sp.]|nr:SGNH/GDSL hydrolase family protein [Pseudarthrobacter sp.]
MPPATDSTRLAPARAVALAVAALLGASLGLTACVPSAPNSALSANVLPGTAASAAQPAPAGLPYGVTATSNVRNPANGRLEAVVPDIARTVLLIGDSQSEPADGWPRLGLAAAGYNVYFCGRGGTGFVAAYGSSGNSIDALQRGVWLLPSGTPALIVVEGGGNDAASGATDARITGNAERLIAELQGRYPGTRMAMIGTLARGKDDGGGRRSDVDALLGSVAGAHGLPFVSVGDWLTRYGLAKDLADSVHMNPSGRRALGGLLERRLRELGLDRKAAPAPDTAPFAAVPGSSGALQD